MDWRKHACQTLKNDRDARVGAWSGHPESAPRVEPTALSALALLCGDDPPAARTIGRQAADWLASQQRADGGLPAALGLDASNWPTALAIILWSALELETEPRRKACRRLLDASRDATPAAGGRSDAAPAGWPWVDGTYTWIEPTALAIIALGREGKASHRRVIEGVGMLHDRALGKGGWNAGNKAVFGRELRPQPTATALALLALAAHGDRSDSAGKAVDYLRTALEHIRSALSLGWGLIALRAWNAYPSQADQWLEEAHELRAERDHSPASLALLLLASSQLGVQLLIPRGANAPALDPTRGPR